MYADEPNKEIEKELQNQYPATPLQGSAKIKTGIKTFRFETHGSSLQKWPHPIMSERELYFIEIKNEKLVFIFQVSVPGGHLGDNEMVIMFFQLISFVLYQPRGYET